MKAARTVISLLVKAAMKTPTRELYRVIDRKGHEDIITAEGLLKRARRIAQLLAKKGVQTGDPVVLMLPMVHERVRQRHVMP